MFRVLTALLLASFALATPVIGADDWPIFRGADRTGVSKDTGLLKEWPADGPPLAWKATGIGVGYSSVSVSGDKVFTMGDADKDCFLFGIDRKTGKKLWELKVGKTGGNYQGPRCTPSTDGELVFALGQHGDLVCASAKSGKEVWRKSLPKDFGGEVGPWNFSESPLLDGDRLVVTPGGPKAAMVVLEKKTGKRVWAGAIDGGDAAGYSSVVIANLGGVKQYVQLMANGLVSFDAKTGKMLWRYGTKSDRFGGNTANIPTPIVSGEFVFAAAGYGRGAALLKVTKDGERFAVEEVYWNKALTNKHGGVILVGDKVFGDRDDSGNPFCADFKTGRVIWTRKGGEGRGSASLTCADGKLYIRYSDGWVALVDATADKYTEISAFKVPNGKNNTWAHPVVVGGRFYVRELDTLWCYDVTAK
ncbi:FOG: WD40 repeat-like protein OS=Pirellula staleyi (strain ATCC 27377 / DSM 6068 / ICPB 4128) GN=Psta_4118 PE=4 SV=1: PQQ_2 [Gemmata massiliana]|uniref:Pyrrolo-quinoline quinone repeat domain-containing protein n=1 Tax=Gemmata massiliana TaxID=1210884 RepID=A0A6P2DDG1_9BACT|nr:PQQ-binding-like beta-propeller repeat protein [Gemmata massiliana]VTS00142.1 FOG: WD40 repeat-like protein OS=Pirellula staleyi (strain ATCC 27377 / DSM 6068 / ICPB 4128) GN=Psta_4118 PE=4 SV=1: PQQ_2 [Gemmata massiliana]